jgi:phage terminase Nu1 subunit (DNA packaging protein)
LENKQVTPKTINAADLAKILDLSEVSIHELVKKNIIPKEGRGKFIPHKCIVYYIRHLREQAAGRGGTDLTDERSRLARAQAERVEMENEVTRGNLISIEDVRKENEYTDMAIRNKLLGISKKLAPHLFLIDNLAETEKIIDDNIYEILLELSRLGNNEC